VKPEDAADRYVNHCRALSLSKDSLVSYRQTTGRFVRNLPDDELSNIRPEQIDAAWASIVAEGTLSANSLRHYRTVGARWLDWCVKFAGLPDHRLRAIELPRKTTPSRAKISLERIEALRSACEKIASPYRAARTRAIVEVLWSTLIRRDELVMLTLANLRLDGEKPQLFVEHGKGGWTGWIAMSHRAATALRAWLKERGDAQNDWLWCNQGDQRLHMSDKVLYDSLDHLAKIAGVHIEDCKPHALRRGGATEMFQNKVPLEAIQALLRHKHLQTTWIYVGGGQKLADDYRNWEDDIKRTKLDAIDIKSELEKIASYMERGERRSQLPPLPMPEEGTNQ